MALIVGDTDTEALAEQLKTFMADAMPTSLEGVSGDLDDWLDGNEDRLGDWLDNLMERLGDWVDRVSDSLSDAKADALSDWLDDIEEQLEDFLDNGLDWLSDRIDGTREADEIRAGDGEDDVFGRGGGDEIYGQTGDDVLDGGRGRDVLLGGSGDDILVGGLGKDILRGGAGADFFVFNSVDESRVGARRDVVVFDRLGGDKIDLSGMDANEGENGVQDFAWIGGSAFSGTEGELRFTNGVLKGDTDGDGEADVEIAIRGALGGDDIIC